jgi:hypothetical protein
MPEVTITSRTLGKLSSARDNLVRITHGNSSGPQMIDPGGASGEGSWSEIISPGKAVDTGRYFVVCPNTLGSSYGSTNAASIDPHGKALRINAPTTAPRIVSSAPRAETGQSTDECPSDGTAILVCPFFPAGCRCDCPAHSDLDAVVELAGGDLRDRAEQHRLCHMASSPSRLCAARRSTVSKPSVNLL